MDSFVFEYPTKVYFGKGAAQTHLPGILAASGPRVMLAYGGGSIKKNGIYEELMGLLKSAGKTVTEFSGIMSNPTWAKVQEGTKLAREHEIDLVLAVGGGSVIDCCKVVCAQAVEDADLWELEMVQHKAPSKPSIPLGAVVTASGTGAEMNGGAVITNEEVKIKGGMFAAAPRFAILDPQYTMSLPASQVLSGAFDTLSHAMETYFGRSDRDNVSDAVAEAVMQSTISNMYTLLTDLHDYTARSNLMWTSAMAENGILKVGRLTDFECHQIEHQLGAYTDPRSGTGGDPSRLLPPYLQGCRGKVCPLRPQCVGYLRGGDQRGGDRPRRHPGAGGLHPGLWPAHPAESAAYPYGDHAGAAAPGGGQHQSAPGRLPPADPRRGL